MTEAVKIRGVAQSDFDQWLPLCEGYNAFYERIGPKAVPMQVTRTTLISGVYAHAKGAGSTRVYWQTHATNITAQRLYDNIAERSGFIVYRKDL